ncbi:MAG: hypothetical protein R8F63_11585 [Acidimicrobiales bacterium]|nr:hypothetical protein [Acidimicrobiales bacterium]
MAQSDALAREVETLLEKGESLLGTFVAIRGPRPGAEAWLVLLGPLVGLFGVLTATGGVNRWRRRLAVGLTDRNVVKVELDRRLRPAPNAVLVRLPRDAITPPPRRTGDQRIQVAGEDLWVTLLDSDEVVRLARLGRSAQG